MGLHTNLKGLTSHELQGGAKVTTTGWASRLSEFPSGEWSKLP